MVDPSRADDTADSSRDGDAADALADPGANDSSAPSDDAADTDESADDTDESTDDTAADSDAARGDGPRQREVLVPDRVYKRVTVFSTLFAVVTVVGGFVLLDVATDRATAPLSEIDPLVALVGVASIVVGAVSYAFSTRFRAEGMGNAKDRDDKDSDNG